MEHYDLGGLINNWTMADALIEEKQVCAWVWASGDWNTFGECIIG